MANIICWICADNLSYKQYKGTKLLSEDGEMPCFECMVEAEEEEDDEQ